MNEGKYRYVFYNQSSDEGIGRCVHAFIFYNRHLADL